MKMELGPEGMEPNEMKLDKVDPETMNLEEIDRKEGTLDTNMSPKSILTDSRN